MVFECVVSELKFETILSQLKQIINWLRKFEAHLNVS